MNKGKMRELLDRSICQWCYGKSCRGLLPCSVRLGDDYIWHTERARVSSARSNDVDIIIIGECVDIREGHDADKIAEGLCSLADLRFEQEIENLCGGYAIFRRDKDGIKVYGDAIHMMSVYYGIDRYKGIVASCEALIVHDVSEISPEASKVLAGAYEPGLYLAGDMTMYDNVKALLPNHYLSLKDSRPVRYFPYENLKIAQTDAEVNECVDNTIQWVNRCIRQFSKRMSFASPLTPGGDSRLNCAFINNLIPQKDVRYYVIETKEVKSFQENAILIKKIAEEFRFNDFHFYPEEETVSSDQIEELKRSFGPIREWRNKIWAYHPDIKDRTIVSGALIGHILGGRLAANMPDWFAGAWFMKVMQRNVSRISGKEVEKWYADARSGIKRGYSKFDLWYWEIRCGRWNANTISRDDLIGIRDINIYNSCRIIKEWCKIPRCLRVRKLIHKRLMERLYPSLASIGFNPCACKGGRVSSPLLDRTIPVWCRSVVAHILEMLKKRKSI